MAERSDITTDWGVFDRTSPRLITVGSPSTALVIQDLVDTLRSNTLPAGEADDSLDNMDDDFILNAEGKVPVQPTLQTGITATLQNAKLLFAARAGPDTILCTITRGNLVSFLEDAGSHTGGDSGTVVIDSAASWVTFGIEANDEFTVENITDGSSATVTAVDSGIQLTTDGLTGGSDNTFQAGDLILVSGFATSPIEPSAFTTVSYAASVAPSITAIDSINDKVDDIHGMTTREIWINTEELVNGVGYQQNPYNNWSDGVDDAESRGLLNLVVMADATVDRQVLNFDIRGLNGPTLDLNGQDMDGSRLDDMAITGSHLGRLNINGVAVLGADGQLVGQDAAINGTWAVGEGIGVTNIVSDIATLIAGFPWVLDCQLAGAQCLVNLTRVTGGMSVRNMDNAGDVVHIHFDQGAITIDSTCTAGSLVITGLVKVTDNSNGTTVDITAVANPSKLLTIGKWLGLRGGPGK